MVRTLLFAILFSACAVDPEPDLGDTGQLVGPRGESQIIVVSACHSCHSAFTLPFEDRLPTIESATAHVACARDAACAEVHAETPGASLSNALGRSCETCHAFVTR